MRIIEIEALENGAHRNQSIDGVFNIIPEGWAIIPSNMECENFPFGSIEVDYSGSNPVVTKWIAGVMPEPEEVPEEEPEASGEYATYDELAKAIREGVNSV